MNFSKRIEYEKKEAAKISMRYFKNIERYICPGYCGVACVDGSCPKALQDEYSERGYDVVRKCEDCCFYEGCKDCCFENTDMCVKN